MNDILKRLFFTFLSFTVKIKKSNINAMKDRIKPK